LVGFKETSSKKWKVHYSKVLQQNLFFISNRDYIDRKRDKAEAGEDLTPRIPL
jgi:hypothetical protein